MKPYEAYDPGADTSPMKRRSDPGVAWECDLYPTTIGEETLRGGWIRSASPAGSTGAPDEGVTTPNPIMTSGNRGNETQYPSIRVSKCDTGDQDTAHSLDMGLGPINSPSRQGY